MLQTSKFPTFIFSTQSTKPVVSEHLTSSHSPETPHSLLSQTPPSQPSPTTMPNSSILISLPHPPLSDSASQISDSIITKCMSDSILTLLAHLLMEKPSKSGSMESEENKSTSPTLSLSSKPTWSPTLSTRSLFRSFSESTTKLAPSLSRTFHFTFKNVRTTAEHVQMEALFFSSVQMSVFRHVLMASSQTRP
jgi:hypothetical protein